MTAPHDKPKRWRPRFSVRALVVVVTLVCCYVACWGPTKTRGIDDVLSVVQDPVYVYDDVWEFVSDEEILDASVKLPLVVRVTTDEPSQETHRYYFWFLGYVAKLPYERGVPPFSPAALSGEPNEASGE